MIIFFLLFFFFVKKNENEKHVKYDLIIFLFQLFISNTFVRLEFAI